MILLWLALHYLCQTASSAPTNSTSTTAFESEDGTVFSTDYRSTAEIVITCLSTILLCTWHVAHPNVREYKAAWWRHLLSKLRMFILALLVPEVSMFFAFRQYCGARSIAEAIKNEWTPVEGHFLQMGGVIFLFNGKHRFLQPEEILNNERDDPLLTAALEKLQGLHRSHITADDILDRSKASGLTKWLTFGQTIWFIVQFVARLVRGLALTELEVITLSYCALNGVAFWLWKDKPLDVQCPIVIELGIEDSTILSNVVTRTASPSTFSSQSIPRAQLSSRRHWDWQPESLAQTLMEWIRKFRRFSHQVVIELEVDDLLLAAMRQSNLEATNDNVEEFGHIGQFFFLGSFTVLSIVQRRGRSIKAFAILILCIPLFALETILVVTNLAWTLAFFVMHDVIMVGGFRPGLTKQLTREYAFAPFYYGYRTPRRTVMVSVVVFSLLASAFGAIHCISWSFTFPSATHRKIWRVCSLLITFIPAVPLVGVYLSWQTEDTMRNPPADGQMAAVLTEANAAGAVAANTECHANAIAPPPRGAYYVAATLATLFGVVGVVSMLLYGPLRVTLIVLAFQSLSSMPPTGHQSLEWLNFVPHL